ncbi:7933_t:CDS:2 [Cetraspora pellucida]|uniref:7933_t:CDS:1 n=1 Tax=Cetraspora pellucida TaxID=1433469 RepID=A0A9N9GE74_9GLOM|nr:7933_t:CDS:2 [Cetraspora pellucida]
MHHRGQGQGYKQHKAKHVTELDNTNTIEYLFLTSCKEVLKQLHTTIYLSFDELWGIPDETQLRAELLALEVQSNQNNYNTKVVIIAEEKEYDSLSAELWGSFAVPILQAVNEDELT